MSDLNKYLPEGWTQGNSSFRAYHDEYDSNNIYYNKVLVAYATSTWIDTKYNGKTVPFYAVKITQYLTEDMLARKIIDGVLLEALAQCLKASQDEASKDEEKRIAYREKAAKDEAAREAAAEKAAADALLPLKQRVIQENRPLSVYEEALKLAMAPKPSLFQRIFSFIR